MVDLLPAARGCARVPCQIFAQVGSKSPGRSPKLSPETTWLYITDVLYQLLKQPCSNYFMNFISIKPQSHQRSLTLPHCLWLIIPVLYTICLHLATLQFY